jgi:hypothetical protein
MAYEKTPSVTEQKQKVTADTVTWEEFAAFVIAGGWHTARPMHAGKAQLPHQYLRRSETPDERAWERMVNHVRSAGVIKPFFRTAYIYLEHGGYQYWTMGWPPDETTVFNRARL